MDAVFALYISLLFMSTMMVLLESSNNYSEDSLALSRLAGDVYEVAKYAPITDLPSFIANNCDNAEEVGSAAIAAYGDIQNLTWTTKSAIILSPHKVCLNES